ncbi:uncharacterized protein SAPINGB_P002829 [Magnusiomyces paraingens]|uniref:MARVEL domain-containing protein n=1 Tax=Magnusiomyces paraingens TaxID=2606893 RepID=A0A5E8BG56_9ASCO|nr:uncharacterized protein SAPINGB_P002829 [Saprochaete ingens]VVT50634.1 unnamed protein product [Saprochaete ingens]
MSVRETLKIRRVESLATSNILLILVRFSQIFFAGVILGIMASYIKTQRKAHETVYRSYVFALCVPVFSLTTQIIYCLEYERILYFLWDFAIGLGYLVSMFWLYDKVEDYLICRWGSFNPFGSDWCPQTRSVIVAQIIQASLWAATAAYGFYGVYKTKKDILKVL